jgi:hypothetical protein
MGEGDLNPIPYFGKPANVLAFTSEQLLSSRVNTINTVLFVISFHIPHETRVL